MAATNHIRDIVRTAVETSIERGMCISDTAQAYGICHKTLARAARIMGVEFPAGKLGRSILVHAKDINTRQTISENARRLGVTRDTVREATKRAGITLPNGMRYLPKMSDSELRAYKKIQKDLYRARCYYTRNDIYKAIGRADLVETSL